MGDKFFGRFPWFWKHVFKLGVFFIARFFHLDIKVIIARDENCMFSYQTFLKVARNWEHNNCLFLPFFILLENENWRSLFLAILRKVWLEDRQFSVLSTITFMSNWRNPVMKKHHPKASIKNRKSKPYTCKLCNKTSVPKTTQNGMF